MKINIRYLPIKAHYFFYWGGIATIWSYINVFGKQMGISEVGVGLIFTVGPIAGLIAKPMFGAIADRFKKKKMIFLFFLLLNLMSFLCVAFLPQNPPVRPVQIDCATGASFLRQCGRINPHCSEKVLNSFKPNDVDRERARLLHLWSNRSHSSHEEDNEGHYGGRDTRSIMEGGEWIENCNGICEIYGFVQGIHFCNSLYEKNQPGICDLMRAPQKKHEGLPDPFKIMTNESHDTFQVEHLPTEELDEILDTDDGSIGWINNASATAHPPPPSGDGIPNRHSTFSSISSRNGPHIIHFDVKLKITEVQMLQDPYGGRSEAEEPGHCLYVPIGNISFTDDFGVPPPEGSFKGLSCAPKFLLEHCYINCPNNSALNRHLESIQEEEELLDAMNFWMYGSLVVIAWIAMSVVESLGDSMCFETLGDEPEKYGRQRLWGTVGWGTFQLIAGYLIDTSSQGKLLKDYTTSFYLLAGLLTIDLIVAYKWSVREVEKTKSLRRDICSVLSNLRIVVFIVACVIVGMCTGLLWSFLFWYVEVLSEKQQLQDTCESHQWIKLLQGLIGATQCLGELPFFFISGWLIQKLGHVHCITLVLFAFGVRFIIYSMLINPWTILPVELLQGLTFGVFYSTMVSYANKISPPGTSATVIGVVQSAFLGIGVASGSLVGGLIFHKYSGGTAFRVFGVGCLIFCAIHALIMCILNKKSNYGFPSDRTEPEGQEMFKISNSTGDVADSDGEGVA